MRVLIIPSWYPTSSKPVNGIFIREQADALSSEHEVRVLYLDVLPRKTNAKPRHTLKSDRGYVEEIIEISNTTLVWQFVYLLRLAQVLRRLRHDFVPEIVHAHIAVPAGWATALLHKIVGAPVVLTENSSEFGSWLKRPGLRWMAKLAFSHVNLVIAVSEGQRKRIENTFHRHKGMVVVPNIVDTTRFKPSPLPGSDRAYRLLFVGLMDTDQKGVQVLLRALALIQDQNALAVPLHVDMVGDGVLRSQYEQEAKRLHVDNMLTFHGLLEHTAVAQLLRHCHALVLPSLHEALPLVIIEAMASGRPVISTRCGGPEYMISDETGLLVEPGQPEPLAAAIVTLLAHLESYDPQRIAAYASSRYSYDAVSTALARLYLCLRANYV